MRELRWFEVLLEAESPHLNLERHKTRAKIGRARKVGLDPGTVTFLRALKRKASTGLFGGDDAHVFVNCDGAPWTCRTFAQHLRRWAERLGLDEGADKRVSGYCLRHSYACEAVEAGISTRMIADQLGHVSTAMVDRVYSSHTRDRERHLENVATEIVQRRRRA
jgi:integrase